MAGKKNLKKSLEDELKKMLEATGEPSEGRMKLIALGIKMCALNAKLEESEYGEFFRPDDEPGSTGGVQKGKEPAARSRANGGADA
jgi:hypothetical protein